MKQISNAQAEKLISRSELTTKELTKVNRNNKNSVCANEADEQSIRL